MVSTALARWQAERTRRLDRLASARLVPANTRVNGGWAGGQLGQWLVLRLASEFQGFCRELHDDAIEAIMASAVPADRRLRKTLSHTYQSSRRLNRGNADAGVLGHDFGMFDIRLWGMLHAIYPVGAPRWRREIELLHDARNGIAHDDATRLAHVVAAGWPPTLPSFRRWRKTLDDLTAAMDHVVGTTLTELLGAAPW